MFRSNRILTVLGALLLLAVGAAATAPLLAQGPLMGLYYQELTKDGRVYVFNTSERFKAFSEGGEMGTAITLVGRAEGGLTLVGENETAVDLYLFKHNLPAYDRPANKIPEPPKFPATKISGRVFADVTSKENKTDDGLKSSDSGVGVDVKRFYFTVNHDFDKTWSAQFQSDIGDQGQRRYDVFVKKAFIQGKFSDAAIVRVGSADTPWIPFVEGVNGMRYFEQTITDSLGFGTSADWGVHFLGKLANGSIDYQFSTINGKGYSNPSRTETVDFEGRLAWKPLNGKLIFAAGGYSGKLGNSTKSNDPAKHTAKRLNLLAAYAGSRFNIGAEYFQADNWKNITLVPEDSADGYSAWAQFQATKGLKIFAGYGSADTSKDIVPDKNIEYYNVGLEHAFNKSFTGTIGYKHAETEGGVVSTGNGNVGSGTLIAGEYNEVGVWMLYNF